MTKSEHVAWAKQRALEIVDTGGILQEALDSIQSDLMKHPDTKDHSGIMLTTMLLMGGHLTTAASVRRHIEGFN